MNTRLLAPCLLIAGTLILSACGNKGPLTLPPKELAPQQVKKAPAPAPKPTAPASEAVDHNSPKAATQ